MLIAFLIVSVVMGVIHRRLFLAGSFFVVLYCFPFTIMHEFSHFVAAFLTGGRPSSFTVWPRRSENGWILGSVRSIPTLLSSAPTALAPLGWLVIGYYAVALWDLRPLWIPEWMIVPIMYACSAASAPSWQDIKIALTHPLSLLLWIAIVYITVTILRTI